VTLHFKNAGSNHSVAIGDFYGEPECAIISKDEKYVVLAGCGLIIYRLEKPFSEYLGDNSINQYSEFFRYPPNVIWISELRQSSNDLDWRHFQFTGESDEGKFSYKMNADTFEIERIPI